MHLRGLRKLPNKKKESRRAIFEEICCAILLEESQDMSDLKASTGNLDQTERFKEYRIISEEESVQLSKVKDTESIALKQDSSKGCQYLPASSAQLRNMDGLGKAGNPQDHTSCKAPLLRPDTASEWKENRTTSNNEIPEQLQMESEEIRCQAFEYLSEGEFDDAQVLLKRTQSIYNSLNPSDPRVQELQIHRAHVMVCMARYDKAIELLNTIKLLTEHIERERLVVLAMVHVCKGDYGTALHDLGKLLVGTKTDEIQDINDARIDFTTYRLLALCYARLGKYNEAFNECTRASKVIIQVERNETQRRDQIQDTSVMADASNPVSTWKGILGLTTAAIHMLFGDLRKALEEASCAYKDLVGILRFGNIQTLEALSTLCKLMAYTSPMEAESFCMDSLRQMTRILGNGHPMTLEILHAVVHILLYQARFPEAVETTKGVCQGNDGFLDENHPVMLQSYSQLAKAYQSLGNYQDAERVATQVVRYSQSKWGHDHPLTLRYKAELAYIHFHLGKFSMARDEVMGVVVVQQLFFSIETERDRTPETIGTGLSREGNAQTIRGVLSRIHHGTEYFRAYADILFSLEVFAKIESTSADPDAGLVLQILQTIYLRRSQDLGKNHPLTLTAEFEVGLANREYGGDLEEAEALFALVYKTRQEILGGSHPETLTARQEQLLTLFALGKATPDLEALRAILYLQELGLDKRHPIALRALMAVFGVQLIMGSEASHVTAGEIFKRLRHPEIRKQRFVESLAMEEQIGILYEGLLSDDPGLTEHCRMVWSSIIRAVNEAKVEDDLKGVLDDFKDRAQTRLQLNGNPDDPST